MYLGEYTLFDILKQNGEEVFQICVITFDIKEPLNHSLTPNYFPLEGRTPDSCKEHNDEQVKLLLESKAEVERYLNQFNGGTKRLAQRDYIVNTLEHFRNWYNEQGLDFPDSDRHSQQPERKFKKQEYEELFNRFLSDPNANHDEVKSILNDQPRWKNPSAYLKQARRKAGLTLSELKSRPGFSWIDPKGTAKD